MPRRRVQTVLLSLLVFAAALAAPAPLVQAQENRRAAAFGIEVRQARRPAVGVEVRLRLDGSSLAPTSTAPPTPQVTDERGRAEFWWLTPGIWQVDLVVDGEVAYFLTVRIEAGRRAQEMGAPARDADAPDMRWKFFRPSGPPPSPPPRALEAEAEEEPPPPPPPVREPVDETPPPPPPPPEPEMPEPEMPEPEMPEPEMPEPEPEPEMPEPEMPEPEMPEPEPEPEMPEPELPEPEPEPEMPEPEMPEPEPEPAMPEPETAPPPVAEVEAEEPELPAEEPEVAAPEAAEAPVPPGQVPEEEAPEEEEGRIESERPQALPQAPPRPTPPPVAPAEPETAPPPRPTPMQPPALEEPFEDEPEAEEPMEEPEPEMTPQPLPAPAVEPPPPPPSEPAAATAPRFSVRSGAEGNCEECRAPETAVRVERTVPAGDGTCAAGSAAAARRLAERLAARGEGLGAGMPLDGQEVVSFTSGGTSCQLFGVVLPPGVRYRGYTYEVADGAGGGGACFFGKQCPIAGALWPNRPTIEELPNGARVVWALFQNASGAALRAQLTAYYIAGE